MIAAFLFKAILLMQLLYMLRPALSAPTVPVSKVTVSPAEFKENTEYIAPTALKVKTGVRSKIKAKLLNKLVGSQPPPEAYHNVTNQNIDFPAFFIPVQVAKEQSKTNMILKKLLTPAETKVASTMADKSSNSDSDSSDHSDEDSDSDSDSDSDLDEEINIHKGFSGHGNPSKIKGLTEDMGIKAGDYHASKGPTEYAKQGIDRE